MEWINKPASMIQRVGPGILKSNVIFFVFLFLQNIAIFWQHYFNNYGFPSDFKAYYAWQAFWTTSISVGIFPQWIPYQSMGYPLATLIQSGLYYPIFWIFPLLHIPYTLHAAVIVQVLHVFFGSIGMFFLLNLIFKSSRYAFIGAVAFQFFGGFYSNAEHSDIIRAFAIAPWLFYVIKLNIDKPSITRRTLFIPIVIYFLATGGYPGIFISSFFIILVFLCLEIFHSYLRAKRRALRVGAAMLGLMAIGISISVIHLGPILQVRNEFSRFHTLTHHWEGLSIRDASALFMSNLPLYGEVGHTPYMTSAFITLPILVFASFIPIVAIKKHWAFVVILFLSVLMVAGPSSPFWQTITSAVPALKLSEFPSGEYKVFVTIPIIILGIAGLKAIMERGLSWKEFTARAAFVCTWFFLGVFSLYSGLNFFVINNRQVLAAVFILLAIFLILLYNNLKRYRSANKPGKLSKLALALVVIIISSDGLRVIYDMPWWRESSSATNSVYNGPVGYNGPLEKNGKLITYSVFQNIPHERPSRQAVGSNVAQSIHADFSWKGYLQGSYMMEDYGNAVLNARLIVESHDEYRKYMLMKWNPLLLEPRWFGKTNSTAITLPISTFSNITGFSALQKPNTDNNVVQTRYGINDISYHVVLKEPKLMVENEMYFPGWQADLIFPNKVTKLQASVVNDVFRAWLLPAGDYLMIAHFSFPNLIIYQSVTIISVGIWVFIIVKYWIRRVSNESIFNKRTSL